MTYRPEAAPLPTSKQTEGSRLRLTIVKEILEAHKGKVWFGLGQKRRGFTYLFQRTVGFEKSYVWESAQLRTKEISKDKR